MAIAWVGQAAGGGGPIARFHELAGCHASEPGEVVIGIETDRGLFVAALVAAGYQVFAVNPMSASRYRDRHSVSGAKSDPGDAKVLADMVRTDRHNHRLVSADSEAVQAVKVLARAHQSMVWSRRRQANMLRSALREFYPAALLAFDDLTSGDALESAAHRPGPATGQGPIAAQDHRGAAPGRAAAPHRAARAGDSRCPARRPRPAPAVAAAMAASVTASVAVISVMNTQLAQLEAGLEAGFEAHPDATVVRSLPGLGTILGARVLGEFGDEPDRYHTAKSRRRTARHITHYPGLRHQKSRASLSRPQPAPGGRHLPLGVRRAHRLTRRPRLLRSASRRRRHPPRRPPRPRQPPRRHPPRLPGPPHHLRRNHRLGTPHGQQATAPAA